MLSQPEERTHVLRSFEIDNARAREKPYKLSDGLGLHLLVQPSGSRFWRLRYYFAGKQNMLSLGSFAEVSLATAREKRDAARKLLAEGKGPLTAAHDALESLRYAQCALMKVSVVRGEKGALPVAV